MDTKETDRTDRLPEKVRLYMEKEKMARQEAESSQAYQAGQTPSAFLRSL